MSQPTVFNSGSEVGNFIVGSGLLRYSWAKISDLQNENNSNNPIEPLSSVRHRVYQHTKFGTIIVFISSPPCATHHFHEDLVSSENLNSGVPNFEFVGTKHNPSFSINKVAVDLYSSIQDELVSLFQYANIRPLIITGNSIGGSIASLFTLRLLENMSSETNKLPLCITFGSPFLGDSGFQKAISERPTWHSSFLHVVSSQDPIPYLYSNTHKPFGTFLLCSDSDSALFEEPETVFQVMVKNDKVLFQKDCTNKILQVIDYGKMLHKLCFGTILRGVSELGDQDFSPLRAGILIQMKAICETTQMSSLRVSGDGDSTVEEIEKRMIRLMNKRKVIDPKKKLSDIKINMTYIEWYKMKASESKLGYYDSFKRIESKPREEIVKRKKMLTKYWTKMVDEVENLPKKEGSFFGIAFLYGGTNYRRIVEPLDIAEWYSTGKTNYLDKRSKHYELLEKWETWEKYYQKQNTKNESKTEKPKARSLTEDSCFWAQVEEATIKCRSLSGFASENGKTLEEDLVKFEDYVMGLINNYAVSVDIFLEQSSFTKWWENYEKIKGDSNNSSLADFMRNHKYKEYA